MEYQKWTFNFFVDEEKALDEKIRSAARSFMNLIIESKYEEIDTFYKTIKPAKNSGQAYLQELKIEEYIKKRIFDIGYCTALLDSMQLYSEKISVQREIDGIKTKYKNDIILILIEKRIMFHKDLAGAIGVSPSGLNAVIKQMNTSPVKLINIDKVSKFKLYSLTPAAYQYGLKLNKEKIKAKKKKAERPILIEINTNRKAAFSLEPVKMRWNMANVFHYEYITPYSTVICESDKYLCKNRKQNVPTPGFSMQIKAGF